MPTSFPFHHKRSIHSADRAKSKPNSRRAYLRYCLQTLPLGEFVPRQIALDLNARTEEKLHRLAGKLYTMGEKLCQIGEIPSDRWKAICDILTHTNWEQVEEEISPYHTLLSEKDFYRCSTPSTRKVMRRHARCFAKRHRLSPESAALLWKGERPTPHRWQCLWLLTALLPAIAVAVWMFSASPPIVALWTLFTLPSMLFGGYLISATLLNRFLPSSPLPLLQSGRGHPTLVVGIGQLEEHAKALAGMERILPTGNSDSRYLLLLTHSDALLSQ